MGRSWAFQQVDRGTPFASTPTKWDKNKGRGANPCYLWLVVDDAGVVGVLRQNVLHRFVRVPKDGGWTGAAATSEAGKVAWIGAAADAPAADAPTMGFAFFIFIADGFFRVFCDVEKMMGLERQL